MSSFISPVSPIDLNSDSTILINPIQQRYADGEAPAAPIGTGQEVLITTPDSTNTDPVVLNITDNASSGSVKVAIGTAGADVWIVGLPNADNAARVEIGLGISNGQILSNAGSTMQIADYYKGDVLVNYDGAIPNSNDRVDLATYTVEDSTAESVASGSFAIEGKTTIAENAPRGLSETSQNAPDFYIKTGSGNDAIKGSRANDFIRAGAGNDTINAGDGNDIVRGGSGSDQITLGAGSDIYYLTYDQFLTSAGTPADTTDRITDFNALEDSIQLAANLENLVSVSGLGTNQVVITYTNTDPASTLTINSDSDAIDEVFFV